MTTYTYSDKLISDAHKDAYGCRPSADFMKNWKSSTPDEKQKTWDMFCQMIEDQIQEVEILQSDAIASFEKSIHEIQNVMNCDINTAIRTYVDSLEVLDGCDFYGASYICYNLGLPYSMGKIFVDAGCVTHNG